MEIYKKLPQIIQHYKNGGNVIQFIRELKNSKKNTLEDILISYDLQSGSYIQLLKEDPGLRDVYCELLAKEINDLGSFDSILEVGVGEGVTINKLLEFCKFEEIYGFDISLSRLLYAQSYLDKIKHTSINLFVSDLFQIALPDNSIDIVYTSHSIEPNGGKEKEAIEELFRVTKKYLILLEPAYDFANEEAKKRMENHGYAIDLFKRCQEGNYEIVKHELFGNSPNKMNPTGLTIIKKTTANTEDNNNYICPITKTSLAKNKNGYFAAASGLLYPVVDNIPCLLENNAILVTHLNNFE